MATNRNDIGTKFETGDVPSQADFKQIFDSFVHKDEDKATAAMVDAGIDNEHYVTPALLRVGLQNIGAITGGGNLPYKQHSDNFEGVFIILDKLPIVSSVKVFKNGQLLLEGESGDYTIDYETATVSFSESVEGRNIEIDYWYKNSDPIPGNGTNYVDLTTNQTVGGNKTFTGITTLAVPAILGREALLTGSIGDNSEDIFQIANGTTASGKFVPTFIGYTNGDYGAMAIRGLSSSINDLTSSSPYIKFLAANTNNSIDPNNGILTSPVNRDLFSWGSVQDYMRMKADGRVLIGNPSDDLSSTLQVSGAIKSDSFVKSGATSDDVLLGDGSTTSLSALGSGSIVPVSATVSGIVDNTPLQELGGVDKLINGIRVGRGNTAANLESTALGVEALNNDTGGYNTAIGFNVLKSNLSGFANIGIGGNSLASNTTGSYNTAVGNYSLYENTTGVENAALGVSSLAANTAGNSNVAIGNFSATVNTTGSFNVAVGNYSLSKNTTGSNNTALGRYSLSKNTTGSNNLAVGSRSLESNTTGVGNIEIINGSSNVINPSTNTTGSNNLVISPNLYGGRTGITTGSGNVVIGKVEAMSLPADSQNTITIADGVGNVALKKATTGEIIAPNLTTALINSGGNRSLVTKEYVELNNTTVLQKEITTTAYTILSDDLNYTIFFNSASPVTVTLNTGLPNNFECDFYNLGTGTVSFVSGTASLSLPDGASLAKDKVATLIRVMSTSIYKLKGELV